MVPVCADKKQEKVNINERINIENILDVLDVTAKVKTSNVTKSGNYYNCECDAVLNIFSFMQFLSQTSDFFHFFQLRYTYCKTHPLKCTVQSI